MDRDHFLYASKKRREPDPNSLTFGKSKAAGKGEAARLEIIPPCDSSFVKHSRPIGSNLTSAVHVLRRLDAPTHKTKSPPMRWSASPLPRTYFPDHAQNRMRSEGDLLAAHTEFLSKRPKNLQLLLKSRYSWMQKYIKPDNIVVEIGAGSGFSKQFIERDGLCLCVR
jgi:hypothetical protein